MNTDQINLQYATIKDSLPDFIYAGLSSYSKDANAYKPQPPELIQKIAQKYDVPENMVYLTAGTDESIQIYAKAYGSNAYIFTPTYNVYMDVEEFGGKLTRISAIKGSEYAIPTQTITDASLIFLANPNNPSGITTQHDILTLARNNPDTKVVIDEAYGEFADLSVIDEVKNFPNMTVFRSFSKAYGMAGNRIGYIIAHPEVIAVVKNKTQWANVSYLSAGAASIAMDHEEYFRQIREDINQRRDEFITFLSQSGFTVFPSKINVILLQFSSIAAGTKFAEFLAKNNVIISHGNGNSNVGLDKSFVRIAIGTKEQMKILKNIIKTYV